MKLSVVFTAEAQDDLQSIFAYVGQDSPMQAILLIERLERFSLALGESALQYPLLIGHEARAVRRRFAGSYNIYYRVTADLVEILHVLHSARDYERILFPED